FHDPGEVVGRMNDRLGRDAADIGAGAARLGHLDDHRIDAELPRADSADIPAAAGPDAAKRARDLHPPGTLRHGSSPAVPAAPSAIPVSMPSCPARTGQT